MATLSSILSAYAGRRVFVTGDTGFKGAWLSFWLTRLGARVHGYALPPTDEDGLYRAIGLENLIDHTDGDVRDPAALGDAIDRARPDHVFHLAAQSLVRPSYDDPVTTFDTNVLGTVQVLEAVRRRPTIRSTVIVTSDKCYENREWPWGYRENDRLGGHDPYSASKAAAEVVFASYAASFFQDTPSGLVSVRAGNVVGGGDFADARIVPDCIRALRQREPIVLRRPEARRPWQHVLEPLGGYLLVALRAADAPQAFGGAWNFGPRPEAVRSVREVAERMRDGWGDPAMPPITLETPTFHETTLLRLNTDKAFGALGWQPRWGFAETIDRTLAWYRAQTDGLDLQAFTAAQIDAYMHCEEQER
jgi:CDP-glucose 4,6-dehydratase